jgi:hypothetical protein
METNHEADPNVEDIEDLNFTFQDVEEELFTASARLDSNVPGGSIATVDYTRQHHLKEAVDEDMKKGIVKTERLPYILGTLIVRVVAARDLDAVDKGGLGTLLFGGKDRSRSSKSGGTANPYATVRFGNTTQQTTEVYETTDPIWPRGEIMYMDVTHTSWENDFDDYRSHKTNPGTTLSKENCSIQANRIGNTSELKIGLDSLMETFESPPKPILTVAIFHSNQTRRGGKYPKKKGTSTGDSDDTFLGMTAIDMTQLFTGKSRSYDEWLPLQGTLSSKASVRVVCEYEASDAPPLPGDIVKFTEFCHPADLYPAVQVGRVYTVHEVDGDEVLISWTSPEGWVSSFLVHRYMLICIERHQSVVGIYQDELASIRERIAYSPLVHVVQETVERVPDEGLLGIGAETIQNGISLLSRWWDNGFETTAQDLTFATNWDGRHNPIAEALGGSSDDSNNETVTVTTVVQKQIAVKPISTNEIDSDIDRLGFEPPLPNMPPCPITGEPMRDPVVAADGHTYERSAIARWLSTSNKSPLTGAILAHKELVPNYMLLSSLQEAATASIVAMSSSPSKTVKAAPSFQLDDAIMADVAIDDAATSDININR